MQTITTHPRDTDKKFSFTQCEGTQEIAALVSQWFQDKLQVRPVGSVTLRQSLLMYWAHLQSLNRAPADFDGGYGLGNPYPLQLGELRAIERAAKGFPRSDAKPDTRMQESMLRCSLKALGYVGSERHNLVQAGIASGLPIAQYLATIPPINPTEAPA